MNISNDIAIIELSRANGTYIQFNDKVTQACLPRANVAVGPKATIVGWGKKKHGGNGRCEMAEIKTTTVGQKVRYIKGADELRLSLDS